MVFIQFNYTRSKTFILNCVFANILRKLFCVISVAKDKNGRSRIQFFSHNF